MRALRGLNARVLLAVALAAGGAAVAIVLVAGDGQPGTSASLIWDRKPLVIRPPDLPSDRVVYGTARNSGLQAIDVTASDLEVRDAAGKRLDATVRFIANYAHGIYGAFQQPDELPTLELERLGYVTKLNPGDTVPLTVSYRLGADSRQPARVYYKGVPVLDIPASADPAH